MHKASVLLHTVGDIALGDHPVSAGRGAHSAFRWRSSAYAFEHVASILNRADLSFGNLECTLSERGLRPGNYRSMQMRGQPSYAVSLKTAGFRVLSMANNHSMQHGPEAFLDTVRILRDAGIGVCGLADLPSTRVIPHVVVKNGLKVVFLGWSLRPRQYSTSLPLYAEGRRVEILSEVAAARQHNDSVVVSLHWGDEFIDRPSPSEICLAHAIMDAGADLIVGHHPHVLRGWEKYGRGWILYSLGNFLSDMIWSGYLRESAVAVCRLTANGADSLELLPMWIGDDYRPAPLAGAAAAALTRRLVGLAAGVASTLDDRASLEAEAHYRTAAQLALAAERKKSRLYFLKHARHQPTGLLTQTLAAFLTSRLARRDGSRSVPAG